MSNPYNSIYDNYDSSGTINFYQLVNNEIIKLFNTSSVNKTYSLSNIYTYKKYRAINEILYIILFITIVILLLTILNKMVTYFDDVAYGILVGVIIAIGTIDIVRKIFDILFRNNINYDEYEYKYDKPDKQYVYKNKPFSTSDSDEDSANKCNKK
jgi:hypothetical protein